MPLGPVELLVVKFPGNQFTGEIAPALKELVDSGLIRVIDILFVYKGDGGELTITEINDFSDDDYAVFDPIVAAVSGLLSLDDVRQLSGALDNNSSAAMMLFENVWATRFRDAIVNANGELVMSERIPKAVIDELLAANQ
jgi:hypothetical protein